MVPDALLDWLNSIGMREYAELLVEEGYDDLETMKTIMKSELPITHEMLKKAGIAKHGHRARILVHLEWGKHTSKR